MFQPVDAPPQHKSRHLSRAGNGQLFLVALLVVSVMPLMLSVFSHEVIDQSFVLLVYLLAAIVVLGETHVWASIAFYFDKRWTTFFRTRPTVFFLVPGLILGGSIWIAVQPNLGAYLVFEAAIILVNVWHHAKQNWGIMALVGKIRGLDTSDMRFPLVWAWPFFMVGTLLRFPALDQWIDPQLLTVAANTCTYAYLVMAAFFLLRSRLWRARDPMAIAFAIALSLWFIPVSLLMARSYSLGIWIAAHGLQYYLIVAIALSMQGRQISVSKPVAVDTLKVIGIMLALTVAAYSLGVASGPEGLFNSWLVRVAVGVFSGIYISHFWLDAFIWKFADPSIRALHGTTFSA